MVDDSKLPQSLTALDQVGRLPYRQLVRDRLRGAILAGELRAGQHLYEVAVADQLGVSATPVREAFRDLEHEGLITAKPHRGAVVASLTHRDLAEMYSLRAHLEQLAVRLAHTRLTSDDFDQLSDLVREMEKLAAAAMPTAMVEVDVAFHRHIVTRADHSLLLQTWERINPSRWTYVTVSFLAAKGPIYIAGRHWSLLNALRNDSVDVAEAAIRDHIDVIGGEVLGIFDSTWAPRSE